MRKLFIRTDPSELDRYESRKVDRRRKPPLAKQQAMEVFYRAMQILPTRELLMIYSTKGLDNRQEEVSGIHKVRQSNISFRQERSFVRIKLFRAIHDICSESQLRRELAAAELNESVIQTVLWVCKTTSQSAAAKASGKTQGIIRNIFSTAFKRVKKRMPDSKACQMMTLVSKNYNQLRAIATQKRWEDKVSGTNYA